MRILGCRKARAGLEADVGIWLIVLAGRHSVFFGF
jgi:hypothetical protein